MRCRWRSRHESSRSARRAPRAAANQPQSPSRPAEGRWRSTGDRSLWPRATTPHRAAPGHSRAIDRLSRCERSRSAARRGESPARRRRTAPARLRRTPPRRGAGSPRPKEVGSGGSRPKPRNRSGDDQDQAPHPAADTGATDGRVHRGESRGPGGLRCVAALSPVAQHGADHEQCDELPAGTRMNTAPAVSNCAFARSSKSTCPDMSDETAWTSSADESMHAWVSSSGQSRCTFT